MQYPPLVVFNHKEISGISSPEDLENIISSGQVCNFRPAMEQVEWDSEACFCPYHLVDKQTGNLFVDSTGKLLPIPRINKGTGLETMRKLGAEVLVSYIALDWDTPGHVSWAESTITQSEFENKFTQVISKNPLLDSVAAFYYSPRGARWVYVLSKPVIPEEAEKKISYYVKQFQDNGIDVDPCIAWNHLFRMPMVVKDRRKTSDDPFFNIFVCDDKFVDPESIPNTVIGKSLKTLDFSNDEFLDSIEWHEPTEEESSEFLERFSAVTGKYIKTEFYKRAKVICRGIGAYEMIFNEACEEVLAPAEGPGRHKAMMRAVGELGNRLMSKMDDITPQHIFALLQPLVSFFDEDPQGNNGYAWSTILWNQCIYVFRNDYAGIKAKKEEALLKERENLDKAASTVDRFFTWAKHSVKLSSEDEKVEFMSRNCLAFMDSSWIYVLGKDGYFSSLPVRSGGLVSKIIQSDMDHIIRTRYFTDKGDEKKLSTNHIIDNHATHVSDIVYRPMTKGGYIEKLNTDSATLYLPIARRDPDLIPERSPLVEEWLYLFAGKDYFETLNKWIGYALAFEEGAIIALALTGPPGTGKGLFVAGLEECLDRPGSAKALDITSGFSDNILKYPFLVVDEGWSKGSSGYSPADAFRQLVSGGRMTMNRKGKPFCTVNNPMRIIMTANNDRVISKLSEHTTMSPDDVEALRQRLMYIPTTNEASKFLAKMGGKAYTGKPGAEWVDNESGKRGARVLARHFLWLHKQVDIAQGRKGRFLMDGCANGDHSYVEKLKSNSNYYSEIADALLEMLEQCTSHVQGSNGFFFYPDKKEFWTTSKGILQFYRNNLQDKYTTNITMGALEHALASFLDSDSPKEATTRVLPSGHTHTMQWHKISLTTLAEYASRTGDGKSIDLLLKIGKR